MLLTRLLSGAFLFLLMKYNSYRDLLKHPEWQRKRTEVLNRDDFTCQLCGDKGTTLHVHHHQYIGGNLPWEYPLENFITYCEICHQIVESLKETNYQLLSLSKADEQILPHSIVLARDTDVDEIVVLTYWFNSKEKKAYLMMRLSKSHLQALSNLITLAQKL